MIKKSLSLTVALLIASLWFVATPALAHELQETSHIGIVMHIEPNDQPTAGRTSVISFELKDIEGDFYPGQCTCELRVERAGSVLLTTSELTSEILAPGEVSYAAAFNFPEAGDYQVILNGTPREQDAFVPFSLRYPVTVDAATDTGTATDDDQKRMLWLVAVGAIVLVAGLVVLLTVRRRKSP